ncbi:MAG: ABC transporter permease [Caldivirga sp.]|uniref:ABC transporter permease n=1 Tax=Caldivirga sp. TaxID=2080243 RepID=UPI003D13E208
MRATVMAIKIGLRGLVARRALTLMTIIAVATAVTLLIALETVTYGVKYTVGLEVKSILPADLMVYTSTAIIPEELVNMINGLKAVEYAAPAILTGAIAGGHDATLIGLSSSSFSYFYPQLIQGSLPIGGDECIVSQQLAQALNVSVGDYIYVYVPQGISGTFNVLKLRVSGVFTSIFGGLLGFQVYMIVTQLSYLQSQLNTGDFVNVIFIKVVHDNPVIINRLNTAMKQMIPEAQVYEQQSIIGSVNDVVNLINVFFIVVIVLSVVIAGLIVAIMVLINVRERRREIGIMKAIGASNGQVMLIFIVQVIVVSLVGGLLGLIGGYYGSIAMVRLINYLGYSIRIIIVPVPEFFALGLATALATGVLASIPPLISVTRIRPAEVIRME